MSHPTSASTLCTPAIRRQMLNATNAGERDDKITGTELVIDGGYIAQ